MPRRNEVWVYRNLKHGRGATPLYSVMQGGRVVRRVRRILLTDCRFIVRPAGRAKTIKTGHKTVHAFVVGTPVQSAFGTDRFGKDLPAKVRYNPFNSGYFLWDIHPLKGARAVLLNKNGMSAALTFLDTAVERNK